MKKIKGKAELREFIRSREMRYFAVTFSGQVHIQKAFKVEIDGGEYWIHFTADGTDVIPERNLVKTMKEAKEEAQKLRDSLQQEKKDYNDKLKDVAKFLSSYYWKCHDYPYSGNKSLKPEEKLLARSVRGLYYSLPNQDKDDDSTYIKLLENYIKHGTIYTQGNSFRKEHVVCVRYGEGGESVQIELINGITIIPASKSVTKLIKTIFGDRLDYWSNTRIKLPTGDRDLIGKVLK